MTTISGTQNTIIYMRLNSTTIQYSTDSTFTTGVNSVSSWPITISNSTATPTSAFTLKLISNLTIGIGITGSPSATTGYININSNWVTIDGNFYGVTISGLTSYVGLIKNGSGTNAFSNIIISKLGILSSSSTIVGSSAASGTAGWLGQNSFGRNTTITSSPKIQITSLIESCWVYGIVNSGAGGIVGSESGNIKIINSYNSYQDPSNPTTTSVIGSKAGGICGGKCNYIWIIQCYVWGVTQTSANPGGGIVGDGLLGGGTVSFIENTYCLYGAIATNAGGYTGTYNYALGGAAWSDDTAQSGGNTNLEPGTIPGYTNTGGNINLTTQIGSVWTDINFYSKTIPWRLTAFNRNPYSLTGVNPVAISQDISIVPLPYTITKSNTRLLQGVGYTYSLIGNNNKSPENYPTITMGSQSNISGTNPTDTSGNLIIGTGTSNGSYSINVLYEDTTLSSYTISTVNLTQSALCFHADTKILCIIDGKELNIPIKDIKIGTEVKTYLHGNKKVILKGMCKIVNNPNENVHKIYKLSKKIVPELIEDLVVVGLHSNLVDELTKEQKEKISKYWKTFLKIDDKYLLMAFIDERFEPCNNYDTYDVYQIVLEHEQIAGRYGVWANGILSETMSLHTYRRKNRFECIEKMDGL
jgi:hypothetical protein